jgi:hypothetical protein
MTPTRDHTPSPATATRWLCLGALALASGSALAQSPTTCQARSGASVPTVLELYTSEGCSSCPPADRWLSTFKGRADVLAMAFHVTYWDRLGWPDRFALPEGTARQQTLAALAQAQQVYTPQVVTNGRDWPNWQRSNPVGAVPSSATPPVLTVTRVGDQVTALVEPIPAGAVTGTGQGVTRLSGFWAVLENDHESRVRAGENAGETLRHDHVVRQYKPLAAWASNQRGAYQLTVGRGEAKHPRRVAFVVTEAATQKPLQAVWLDC